MKAQMANMRCIMMAGLVTLTTHFGAAQEGSKGERMTLEQCVARALEQSPAMTISEARVTSAEARASEVRTQLLPSLRLSARAALLSEVPEFVLNAPPPIGQLTIFPSITENYGARLTLQQPLFTGFRLLNSYDAASLHADAAREDWTKDRADLTLQVTTTFWTVIRGMELERTLNSSIRQMQDHVKDLRAYVATGMATDLDQRKAEVQLASLEVRRIEARSAVRVATMQLNSLIGRELTEPLTPAIPDLAADTGRVGSAEFGTLMLAAKEHRPEIRAMERRKAASIAGLSAAQAGWYPSVALVANYDYANPNQRHFPQRAEWNDTWDVGLSLQWNIWDWLATSHQSVQAEASVRQSEAALIQIQDAVVLDVAQSTQQVIAAREMVTVALAGVAAADETKRITTERFKQGIVSSTDVLDAHAAAIQAEATLVQARADLAIALAKRDRAIGAIR